MISCYPLKRPEVTIFWFKRDLRVFDNRALFEAAQQGSVLPVYVVEPEYWSLIDMSARHWDFVSECLSELRKDLTKIGQPLVIRQGNIISVLDKLKRCYDVRALYSHEETGNSWTFERDKKVLAWCKLQGVCWVQLQQHGVKRKLKSRNGWAKSWDRSMAQPLTHPPSLKPLSNITLGNIPSARDLGLSMDPCQQRQIGGRSRAIALLQSFLNVRGEYYRSEMSNPLKGAQVCSRLSPYLAWGSLSMREVVCSTSARATEIKLNRTKGPWPGAISSFKKRLHWHCHFMQKLEDEPNLELQNLHRSFDGLRPKTPDHALLTAWMAGETGIPFVDACMRSLKVTGWLNFRMRAMVTAFASYHLWLDWRLPGEHLARMFTDYEPGIHWPQLQMQSGTTGINTLRIYNPVKQGYDQDPKGTFTRRWVPELSEVGDKYLQEPWKSEKAKILGKSYPFPIVDHQNAAKNARQKIWSVRSNKGFNAKAREIFNKHGSRRKMVSQINSQRLRNTHDHRQLSFKLDAE